MDNTYLSPSCSSDVYVNYQPQTSRALVEREREGSKEDKDDDYEYLAPALAMPAMKAHDGRG